MLIKIFNKLFGYCHCCKRYFKYPIRRELNTAYEEDEMNWIYTCKECYKEAITHYEEMWLDYYMSR